MIGLAKMRIMGIDPSSTMTGMACIEMDMGRGPGSIELISVDRFSVLRMSIMDRMNKVNHRITSAARTWHPDWIVIETPAPTQQFGGPVQRGQATYGMVVGWAMMIADNLTSNCGRPGNLRLVMPNKWTGGVPKKARAQVLKAMLPEYNSDGDSGLDIADAIGLAYWFAEEHYLSFLKGQADERTNGGSV